MKFSTLITGAIVLALAGCATGPTMSTKEKNAAYADYVVENKLPNFKKINSFRFHGWQSLTDEYLILSTSVKKKYLIELRGYCPDLDYSHAIKLNQSMSGSLVTKFDSISVLNGDRNSAHLKCHIKSIHQLTKAQAKEIAAIGDDVKPEKSAEESTDKDG